MVWVRRLYSVAHLTVFVGAEISQTFLESILVKVLIRREELLILIVLERLDRFKSHRMSASHPIFTLAALRPFLHCEDIVDFSGVVGWTPKLWIQRASIVFVTIEGIWHEGTVLLISDAQPSIGST